MNIVTLIVDRLQAAYLGAYGNTWISTPQCDRLAAESWLADQALVSSADLPQQYPAAWWQGRHPLQPTITTGREQWLPALAAAQGHRTLLLSDDPLVRAAGEPLFGETVALETSSAESACEDLTQTGIALALATACDTLAEELAQDHPRPLWAWLHLGSLNGPWDAPAALREQYREEDDEAIPTFVTPPDRLLPRDFDPDERLACQRAYAAQVTALDTCLGPLLDLIREADARQPTLFLLAGARGYPLGEHRQVGPTGAALYSEQAQVPFLIRWPGAANGGVRSQALVQPHDWFSTLLAVWEQPATGHFGRNLQILATDDWAPWCERIVYCGDHETWFRTPAWALCQRGDKTELYVKPEDRWEINDVADRCTDVVDLLSADLVAWQTAVAADEPVDLPALPDVLRNGIS